MDLQPASTWQTSLPPPAATLPVGAPASDGLAVAALVTGVLALSLAVNPLLFLLALPAGVAALVLGFLGVRRAGRSGAGRGVAVGGLVTGGLGTLLAILWVTGIATVADRFDQALTEGATLPLAGGVSPVTSAPGSRCEQDGERRVLPGPYVAGAFTLTDVEVCPDFADDFAFGATVTNTGGAADPVTLRVRALAAGQPVGEADSMVTVPPGSSSRVDFIGFDDYRSGWDAIDVQPG